MFCATDEQSHVEQVALPNSTFQCILYRVLTNLPRAATLRSEDHHAYSRHQIKSRHVQ